jgi:hypothetical protein
VPATERSVLVAGGAVQAGGGLYLERAADRDLLARCRNGDFTYILTSRQMGKSSLMIRTAERLAAEGARPVIVDLTEIGSQTTAEQWYRGFLFTVEDQLGLTTSAARWWETHADLSVGHRFARFFTEVVLTERSERIVIFVDEIDTTLRLNFTDDFFAGIRYLYQARASEPELERLSFVLIGVATPGDLIKDAARTPFNVGYRIDLSDFTIDEVLPLAAQLPIGDDIRRDVMRWITRWTAGHPYLTLRVVRSLDEAPPASWTEQAIDERVAELFFSSQGEKDSNLQFVRDMLTKNALDTEAVLRTYHNVRRGQRVPDRELDQITAWLKLSGIVCRRDGNLYVRNAIYERVFDNAWARDHLRLHANWRRRAVRALQVLVAIVGLITIPLSLFAVWQWRLSESRRGEAERALQVVERRTVELQRAQAEAAANADRTMAALSSAEAALAELRRYNPRSAATLSANINVERQAAEKEIADRAAKLRTERDAALTEAQVSEQTIQSLRDENTRLKAAQSAPEAVAQQPMVPVPDVLGRHPTEAVNAINRAGLRVGKITQRPGSTPTPTVVAQAPMGGVAGARGSIVDLLVSLADDGPATRGSPPPADNKASEIAAAELTLERLHVYHDSTAGGTDWSFEVFVDNRSVMTLPGATYREGNIYRRPRTTAVRPAAASARIRVVGTRLKQSVPLSVEGTAVVPLDAAPLQTTVLAMAKSGDPLDGEFAFVFNIRRVAESTPAK